MSGAGLRNVAMMAVSPLRANSTLWDGMGKTFTYRLKRTVEFTTPEPRQPAYHG